MMYNKMIIIEYFKTIMTNILFKNLIYYQKNSVIQI